MKRKDGGETFFALLSMSSLLRIEEHQYEPWEKFAPWLGLFNSVYEWRKRKKIKRKECKDVKVAITNTHKHSKLIFQGADMLNHPIGIKY